MGTIKDSFSVPYSNPVLDNRNFLTRPWEWFFRSLWMRVYALGDEQSFQLENNKALATTLTGLRFDKTGVSQATVEYLIQRVTTGVGATELIESGILLFVYRPTLDDWDIVIISEEKPDDAGVDFSITSDGFVQYTSTNITGTYSISKITYRARTLAAKNPQYSFTGTR